MEFRACAGARGPMEFRAGAGAHVLKHRLMVALSEMKPVVYLSYHCTA